MPMTDVMASLLKDELTRLTLRGRVRDENASVAAVRAALGSDEDHLLIHARVWGLDAYRNRFGAEMKAALRRLLEHRLALSIGPAGRALESQPTEVTILVAAGDCELERWGESVCAAVAPSGAGFSLTASWGAVALAGVATRPAFALAEARRGSVPPPWDVKAKAGPEPNLRAAAYGLPGEVEDLCRAVAERLELTPENIGLLAVAAAVHDAGKAAIPTDVLAKPAALDHAERDLVARHPRAAEHLMLADPALAPAAPIVGALHAPWRTVGTPARILAAAVAFEAMTRWRADRPAMSTFAALSGLRAEAGERFDPCVVNAVIGVLAERAVAKL